MNAETRLKELEKNYTELKEKIDFLEFRIDLIASTTNVNKILYEYNVNRSQYNEIMDLMDEVRNELDKHKTYNHVTFEQRMKRIFPAKDDPCHDYHFAEEIALAFLEDGRWEEVFPALYSDTPKFKYFLKNMKNGGK